jgi:futalosine hydrolase
MRILIVSATSFEIRPFAGKLTLLHPSDDILSQYRYHDNVIDILITGIGMTATAFHTGRQLLRSSYDLVVNAGICGSFESNIQIGTVVNITEEVFSEMGAENKDQFITLFDLGLMDPNDPPFHGGKLVNPANIKSEVITGLQNVRGITSNTIHGNMETIRKIKELFRPEVESMEGAAFFYACLSAGVPFYQVRSVSNYVKERDKSKWDVKLALKNLNSTLMNFLNEVSH